jgi:hypothetical protein
MRTLTAITLTLSAASLLAQPKPAAVDVTVHTVNDRRTSGSFSHLTIELEMPKIRSADVEASRVLVAAATDDTGRSLTDPKETDPQLQPNIQLPTRPGASEKPPPPASVTVTLANPDRKAKSVKELRGEIELYMPSKDPNSTAEIPKLLSFSGKPLAHKALKANAIEIALLSPAQLDAERKRLGDVKRKEYKTGGFEDGEDLDNMVKSYLESLLTVEESDVLVRIKDPNHRIQDVVYVDAAGEVKRINSRTEEGLTYLSTWEGKPQPDWKLKVSMKTPKNMVRYAFAVKDVALP